MTSVFRRVELFPIAEGLVKPWQRWDLIQGGGLRSSDADARSESLIFIGLRTRTHR